MAKSKDEVIVTFRIEGGVIVHATEHLYDDDGKPRLVSLHNSRDIADAVELVENTPIKGA